MKNAQLLNSTFVGEQPIPRSRDLEMAEIGVLLAQTAFGESVILPGLMNLKSMFKTPGVLRIIDSHIKDEERHAHQYAVVAESYLPGVTKNLPAFYQDIKETFESTEDPTWLLSAMHLCLECFAMGAFEYRKLAINSEAITALDSQTLHDELRHVGFGPVIAGLLQKEGINTSSKEAIKAVRMMHQFFMGDSIVEQVVAVTSETPQLEGNKALENYRQLCTSAYEDNLVPFMRALRGRAS